jgi:hypothetical protein
MDYLILYISKASKRSIKFKSETDTRLSPTPYSYNTSAHKVVTNKVDV